MRCAQFSPVAIFHWQPQCAGLSHSFWHFLETTAEKFVDKVMDHCLPFPECHPPDEALQDVRSRAVREQDPDRVWCPG